MPDTPDFRFRRDYLVYRLKTEGVYLIQQADWERLKRQVRRLVVPRRLFEVVSSVCFGVFASSLLAVLAFLSVKDLPRWVLPSAVSILVVSLLLGIAFEVLGRQQRQIASTSIEALLEDMKAIEESLQAPEVEQESRG